MLCTRPCKAEGFLKDSEGGTSERDEIHHEDVLTKYENEDENENENEMEKQRGDSAKSSVRGGVIHTLRECGRPGNTKKENRVAMVLCFLIL